MPIGDRGALPNNAVQTEWPLGDNTNYWFRRDFTIDEIHKTSRYMLHVLHDDSYRIYFNGVLLDEADNWTTGYEAVKLEIPAALLNEGNNVIAAYVQQNFGGKLYDCGLTEEPDFYEEYDENADPSQLVFNEIMIGNIDQYIDYSYNYGAWAEIYNPTLLNISLDGLYITDNEAEPRKFRLPAGTGVIKGKGYKVLYFDHNSADGTFGDTANKQIRFKLDNSGGTLYLYDQSGKQLTSADYPECITRCSWARKQDGGEEWSWTGEPTLASTNNKHPSLTQTHASSTTPSPSKSIFPKAQHSATRPTARLPLPPTATQAPTALSASARQPSIASCSCRKACCQALS